MGTSEQVSQPNTTWHPERGRSGWTRWLATVDHKQIGILYMCTALVFFVVGGTEVLLMRIQLSAPRNTFLSPEVYNQLLTMHGTTMVFFAVMPLNTGLANYLVPLMIGARDVAFPRLNAFGFWMLLSGAVMLYSSFLFGGAPNAGWFGYAPLTERPYAPGHGIDFWALGLILSGVGSISSAVNLLVTILNLRAPGMSMTRMPVFVWMILIMSGIMLVAFPSFTAAAIMLLFDRTFGTRFFVPAEGGDVLLWQHLFWFFGHPEVYIMALPAFGVISEVVPTFARKPIFGYMFIVFSGIAIGFLSITVWAHHMFAVGMGPLVDAAFSTTSMLIAIPTGIKIFTWIATLWGGVLEFKTPLYFAVGFIAMFVIGGISGIAVASPPVDLQVTDTYFVVAHFHYVLFGGAVFAIFAGFFYWFPKITGRMLDERLGKLQFWLMVIGFNVTFFPMHLLGLWGMPRRIATYDPGLGWTALNVLETVGAFGIAASVVVLMLNLVLTLRRGAPAPGDPWDGATLEWATTSPPPPFNFANIPRVASRRPLWDIKYPQLEGPNSNTAIPRVAELKQADIDQREQAAFPREGNPPLTLPRPTRAPLALALSLFLAAYGFLFGFYLTIVGLVLAACSVLSWANTARVQPPHAKTIGSAADRQPESDQWREA